MPLLLVLFTCGVIASSFLSSLPSLYNCFLLLPIAIGALRWRWLWYFFACMMGMCWGIYAGHNIVQNQLATELVGKDVIVTGTVIGLPQVAKQRTHFLLQIDSLRVSPGENELQDFPHKIQLSWYSNTTQQIMPAIKTGDRWELRVRLKRPRGFVNPAGFDYQAWLLRRGIGATGYVVSDIANRTLEHNSIALPVVWIDQWRYQLQQWLLTKSDSTERGILIALLIGDSTLVDKDQWLRMQKTGTNHLIAISGLHVGFLALFGFYAGLLLGKCIHAAWRKYPALVMAYWTAMIFAFMYSALAGFNIPTIRTLIMLMLFYWLALRRRSSRVVDIFCIALASVVVLDPLAAFDMGFWLSFVAVGLLLFYFSGRYVEKNNSHEHYRFSIAKTITGFARSQWLMLIGLLIPLALLVNSVSLSAPVANFIAIPLVTFFVVPCLLLAAALQTVFPWLSQLLLDGAEKGLELLRVWLEFLLAMSPAQANPVIAFQPGLLGLISLSCLILLLPKGLIPRSLGIAGIVLGGILTFSLKQPDIPLLSMTILDVGQGSAFVIQTVDRVLLYDTGPMYSDNFDAGSGIVLPYLHAQGITHIDTLVVSHLDMDHAGGIKGLLGKITINELLLGEKPAPADKYFPRLAAADCHTKPPWQWGEIKFRFLTWPIAARASANNHSCVLLIEYATQKILLPGDIEKEVEMQLLRGDQLPTDVTVLLAAHHGSHSSSTPGFVNYVRPHIVVYSAGYRNQHGHPRADVRKRYQAIGSREFNTAESGALVFTWRSGALQKIAEYRQQQRRYWFE